MEKQKIGVFKKIRKGTSFVLVPAFNYKSFINIYKSIRYFLNETKNKYDESKDIKIDKINDVEVKSDNKDVVRMRVLNIISLSIMLLYFILIILNSNSIIKSIVLYSPIFIMLSTLSFSLSFLKYILINKRKVKIRDFIKEVKKDITLLIP